MKSSFITTETSAIPLSSISKENQSTKEVENKFSNILKTTIEDVNNSQLESDNKTNAFIQGDVKDLHEVMISAQKASITLEATVQIQKKVIDAYNEVMRMQV